ncbi:acetyl-CoA carboxylase biotin carboxylase subunit family protein [Chryseobacterium sp. WLY505]|uniref:ATP-grasp domain-containing protein n=1 Tax=Chryseobacterium sp. WLY505 TaxID=3068892 RepID=UPI0027967468|nr:ATP-grasp domain-containing protein [Chryseobacterium sp. WLY505]MDQ1857436.1 ATP-grasp domain-containing protein [Chryseobacterium sp. WLY505]
MKKIAILGASYLQMPLVQKAKENGYEVHCFAWDDGRAVCKEYADYFYDISVLEKELILDECKKIGIDGILTIATDICIPTIASVAHELNLTGNSIECSLLTTNKSLMRKCFEENNIRSPRSITVSEFNANDFKSFSYPLIIKPSDRSGSLGVIKAVSLEEAKQGIENAISCSFSKTCVVEEYIKGKEVSVETISFGGKHQIIIITDKVITTEPYFVELAHHQPSSFPEPIQDRIIEMTYEILNATKVENGASHVELMITENGDVYPIEIGSRMGGDFIGSDLVQLSTGFDYVQAVLDIALGQFMFPVDTSQKKYSGVYFLSENTKELLPFFTESQWDDYIVKKEITNPSLQNVHSSNDRSGYLIYQSDKKIELL